MARITAQGRVAVANRAAMDGRLKLREFENAFITNGARHIDLTSTLDPMAAPTGLIVWMRTPTITGSNQIIYAQLDGAVPAVNVGRIWMMIRATTGILATFFGGVTTNSSIRLKPNRNYMLGMYFDPVAQTVNFYVGDRTTGQFTAATQLTGITTETNTGAHRLFASKTPGGYLQRAFVQRVELINQPMAQSDFEDIFYRDRSNFNYEHRLLLGEGAGVNITSEVNGITGVANSAAWTPRTMFKPRTTP